MPSSCSLSDAYRVKGSALVLTLDDWLGARTFCKPRAPPTKSRSGGFKKRRVLIFCGGKRAIRQMPALCLHRALHFCWPPPSTLWRHCGKIQQVKISGIRSLFFEGHGVVMVWLACTTMQQMWAGYRVVHVFAGLARSSAVAFQSCGCEPGDLTRINVSGLGWGLVGNSENAGRWSLFLGSSCCVGVGILQSPPVCPLTGQTLRHQALCPRLQLEVFQT